MTKKELESIIQEGESYKVEFKESVDKTFVEEVCAFANASGGRLFIGVSDSGEFVGTDTSNSARSRIQDTIRQIQSDIHCDMEIFENIIILSVPEGEDKPYGCSKGFYLRVGPNSQKLNRNEIIKFIQAEGRVKFDELLKVDLKIDEVISKKTYQKYLKAAGISDVLPVEEALVNLGCSVKRDSDIFLNNAGILFFAERPMVYVPQASVTCAIYKGVQKVIVLDRKDLTGDLVAVIDEAILYLKMHLKLRYEIYEIRRKEILEIPETAIREAVVNAVCHRDYFEKGANVMVEIFDDRVEISNPGGLPSGLNKENFGTRSVSRNPIISSMLHRIDYIEKMGTGINRMKEACLDAGIAEPEFSFSGFFTVVFQRIDENKTVLNEPVNEPVNRIEKIIVQNKFVSINSIAEQINMSRSTVKRLINVMKEKGVLKRIGSDKTGYWEVINENEPKA